MLKIGWASKDISTEKPVNIYGQFHARISKGVLDPVTVNALVIEDGSDIAIFMSGDLVAARCGLLDEIRAKVNRINPAIPVEKILFNVTHTHCGPPYVKNPTFPPHEGIEIASHEEYRDFLSTEAAKAVSEAYKNRSEGGIAYGYGYAVVSHSRRVLYFDDLSKRPGADVNSSLYVDGHARMYGNTNDPMFSGYEAGADHFINLLYTFDKNEKLTGAIINVPCPSQNSELEYYLSADYWHDVRLALRDKYGDINIISQCAAAGDLSPRVLHYKKAQARRFSLKYSETTIDDRVKSKTEIYARKDISERICAAFDEVFSWAKKDIKWDLPVKHTVKTIELSKRLITDEEYEFCRVQLEKLRAETDFVETGDKEEDFKQNSRLISRKNRFSNIIRRYEEQKNSTKLPMELHVIRIGEIAFASNRFELFMDYQHRIQARSPFTQTFVVQLSAQPGEEGGSYLATERGVEGGGYSATMYCNQVSPKGGQELVEETLVELNKLYDNNMTDDE